MKKKEIATSDEFDKGKIKEYESKLNDARSEMTAKENVLRNNEQEAMSVGKRAPDLRWDILIFMYKVHLTDERA